LLQREESEAALRQHKLKDQTEQHHTMTELQKQADHNKERR